MLFSSLYVFSVFFVPPMFSPVLQKLPLKRPNLPIELFNMKELPPGEEEEEEEEEAIDDKESSAPMCEESAPSEQPTSQPEQSHKLKGKIFY